MMPFWKYKMKVIKFVYSLLAELKFLASHFIHIVFSYNYVVIKWNYTLTSLLL